MGSQVYSKWVNNGVRLEWIKHVDKFTVLQIKGAHRVTKVEFLIAFRKGFCNAGLVHDP